MSEEFRNKIVIITGGGGVLCSTVAVALAEKGARVAVLDLKAESAEEVAAKINNAGGEAIGIATNVLDVKSLRYAHDKVLAFYGLCNILINGAGGLLPTQIFAKDMIDREGCNILNISSMNTFRPLAKIPAYSAAKAAVSNFTQWLAVHFSKAGIWVNALAPGFFLTKQNGTLLTDASGNLNKISEIFFGLGIHVLLIQKNKKNEIKTSFLLKYGFQHAADHALVRAE